MLAYRVVGVVVLKRVVHMVNEFGVPLPAHHDCNLRKDPSKISGEIRNELLCKKVHVIDRKSCVRTLRRAADARSGEGSSPSAPSASAPSAAAAVSPRAVMHRRLAVWREMETSALRREIRSHWRVANF